MHPLILLLLLLPGTSLHDWERNGNSSYGSCRFITNIALMNARTAEQDKITPEAACRSIAAGERMAANDSTPLPYSANPNNLSDSLSAAGVVCEANDSLARLIAGNAALPVGSSSAPRRFIVEDFDTNIAAADKEYDAWYMRHGVKIIVVSPNPSQRAYRAGHQLTPIDLYGLTQGNVLTSPSTRTNNLVTNTDIAPTIAKAFGVTLQSPVFGSAIFSPYPGTMLYNRYNYEALEQNATTQFRAMKALPYIALLLAVVLGLVGRLVLVKGANVDILTTLVFAVPLALIALGANPIALLLWGLVIVTGVLCRFRLFGFAGVATILLLLDAIILHGTASGGSVLGYSPIEGARYYGVGNEVMGFWIGAATYFCARLADKPRWKYAALAIAVAVVLSLGLPGAGAKAGGFLVGILTLGAAIWARSGRPIRPVTVAVAIVAALAAGCAGLLLFGKLFGASHVTQTAGLIRSQGGSALLSVVGRKAGMDIHLMFHSVWMLTLIVACVTSWLALRPIWKRPDLPRTEVIGLITATAASFALNDAGVVAAALCSLTLWSSAMLLHRRLLFDKPVKA